MISAIPLTVFPLILFNVLGFAFGGSRRSGTNDKAGSKLNLLRWVSARAIKETFVPPTDYRYPFMAEP